MDTIYALSSGRPPSGVAVIRLSGPLSFAVARDITGLDALSRTAMLCSILNRNNEMIDRGLVLGFAAPASFTGEDVVEFQIHGSLAVVRDLEAVLSSYPDMRPAMPGEFAQRAFINGKMDLTEAEGLADLIDAQTSEQRRLALRQSQGETVALLDRWATEVLELRSLIEASIDFADEDDIASDVEGGTAKRVQDLIHEIVDHVDHSASVEAVREGILVVLAGAPNAGKSSLFNKLVGEERVIVSEIAGTTRDYVEQRIDLDGYLVRLVDTAGLRDTTDLIEREGVSRTKAMLDEADLVVEISDVSSFRFEKRHDRQQLLRVASKRDLSVAAGAGKDQIHLSIRDADSLDRLRAEIISSIRKIAGGSSSVVPINARQAALLRQVLALLQSVDFETSPVEMRADALARANQTLGHVVGRHDVEDILGSIFSRFCIGK